MNKSEKFKKDLEILYRNCNQAKLHFDVWKSLNEGLNDKNLLYRRYHFFWDISLKAQLESAQLHMLKLFDRTKGTVTIDSVIKYAESNKKDLFDANSFDDLDSFINEYRSEIIECEDTINSLNRIRNRHFVHLSKEYSRNYDELYENYLKIREDIIEIISICSNIITEMLRIGYGEYRVMVLGFEYQTSELIQYLYERIMELE